MVKYSIFFNFLVIITVIKCGYSQSVELLIDYDTINLYADRTFPSSTVYECDGVGLKFVYNASNKFASNITNDYYRNNIPRYMVLTNYRTSRNVYPWRNTRYAAYVLESGYTNYCKNICLCTIDDQCYTFENSYGYVEIVPFCQDSQCFSYAITYRNSSVNRNLFQQSNIYGELMDKFGNKMEFPDPFNVSLGINSPYLKVNRISCNGCERIYNAKCIQSSAVPPAESLDSCSGSNDPNYVGLTITFPTYLVHEISVKPAEEICQCDNGIRYLWPKTEMNSTEQVFEYGMCDKSILCVCTTDGVCYEDTGNSQITYVLEFWKICENNNCFMQLNTTGDSIVNIYNTSEKIPPRIKIDSLSCNGCGALLGKHKCYQRKRPTVNELSYPTIPYSTIQFIYASQNYTMVDVLTPEYTDILDLYTIDLIDWFCQSACLTGQSAYSNFIKRVHVSLMAYYGNYREDLFNMNFYFRLFFGIPALLICLLVILLILRQQSLLYGYICIFIAACDIILISNILISETLYDIRSMSMNKYMAQSFDRGIATNYQIFGIGIDSFTYYVCASFLAISVLFGTYKSLQRFLALYTPIFYYEFSSNKFTIRLLIISMSIVLLAFGPILVFAHYKTIQICYIYGVYYHNNNAECDLYGDANGYTIWIKYIRDYWDYGNIAISLLLDFLTAFKLYKIRHIGKEHWPREKSILEKLFLLQNFVNAFSFVVFLFVYYIFVYVCSSKAVLCIHNFPQRFIVMFSTYNSSRVMWRFFDELITFGFQLRAYFICRQNILHMSTSN